MSPPIRPTGSSPTPTPDPNHPPPQQPNNVNSPPPDPGQLVLDLTQMGLDIAGIFDPTPISDGSNAVISLFRGDLLGAGLSAVSIIPYVGDAAKLGKLGKWAETISNAVELALRNSDFAQTAAPLLAKIADAIDGAPRQMFDALPADAQRQLLEMRAQIGRLPGARAEGPPGSLSHKGNAWSDYQARGGEWSYERWSTTYDSNMTRATDANRAVDDLHAAQGGWGTREQTVEVTIDGQTYTRRLDIGDTDPDVLRGLEHKSGYAYLSQENAWEIERDAQLVRDGWDIEWVIDGTASRPLVEALQNAGIRVTVNGEVI